MPKIAIVLRAARNDMICYHHDSCSTFKVSTLYFHCFRHIGPILLASFHVAINRSILYKVTIYRHPFYDAQHRQSELIFDISEALSIYLFLAGVFISGVFNSVLFPW